MGSVLPPDNHVHTWLQISGHGILGLSWETGQEEALWTC